MTGPARAIIAVGVMLIPQQERRRYAEEFDSNVLAQSAWGRLPYAVSLVLGMLRLRWVVLHRLAGQPVPFCFMGLHRNLTVHPNPDDPLIIAQECILCHRIHDPRQYLGRANPKGLAWIAAGQGK